ncbi:hypothetical protein [Enterocloster clostridioformis]|uniref:hypothetical protein n=2 Tax=Enterocloster clostridioformis TaxID=1531 RepID=UPI0011BDA1C3|nr:hypothetical protein [Enterocloster clostridioformis]MCA5577851.1 hypothetical protein [Enterocloster clostridioformis]
MPRKVMTVRRPAWDRTLPWGDFMGEAEYFRETAKFDTCLGSGLPDVFHGGWYGLRGHGSSCIGEQH